MKQRCRQFIVDETGNKTAVVLPLEEYEELMEDIHDLAVIAERKDEPAIDFDKFKRIRSFGRVK
ncbi:MAG: type II toxin-antitoxin system Phd/YefM family antitoxin [Nitrospirae bacterium]|nr:type II toxin-antitoxin system Phd/YefM family antitoxin [Nitrospirota bacterium]